MIAFPEQFPLPTTALSADEQANAIRTRMDSGTVRQRRRFTTEMLAADVTWELTDEETALFIAFHRYKLNLGSDWFTMLLPLGGGVQVHTVRIIDGQFSQKYVDVGRWEISCKLDVQERFTYSEDLLDIFLNIGANEDDISAFLTTIASFHTCVNENLPNGLN